MVKRVPQLFEREVRMTELHKIAFDYRNAVLPNDAHKLWIELEKYVKQLINEEREACAVIAFNAKTYIEAAEAIRARGQG